MLKDRSPESKLVPQKMGLEALPSIILCNTWTTTRKPAVWEQRVVLGRRILNSVLDFGAIQWDPCSIKYWLEDRTLLDPSLWALWLSWLVFERLCTYVVTRCSINKTELHWIEFAPVSGFCYTLCKSSKLNLLFALFNTLKVIKTKLYFIPRPFMFGLCGT